MVAKLPWRIDDPPPMQQPLITSRQAIGISASMLVLIPLEWLNPVWGQLIAGVIVWLGMLWLMAGMSLEQRLPLWLCIIYATAGEIFLSLVWGLYDYRLGNIPPFVPPGHVLLFLLGMYLAPRLSERIVWLVPGIATPYFIWGFFSGHDQFGPLLFGLFLLGLWIGGDRRLYTTMFVIALLLELWGTAWGTWRWVPVAPWFGLSTTNPPLASGAFYSTLDLLIVMSLPGINLWLNRRNAKTAGLFAPQES